MKYLCYRENVSAIAPAVVCAMKFVNSFARRQHPFDIATKPINTDSIFLTRILLLCSGFNFSHNNLTHSCFREFYRNPFGVQLATFSNIKQYLARAARRGGQGWNIVPPVQHRLWRLPYLLMYFFRTLPKLYKSIGAFEVRAIIDTRITFLITLCTSVTVFKTL